MDCRQVTPASSCAVAGTKFVVSHSLLGRQRIGSVGRPWFPCNKAGDFRKWFGNAEYVVNWESDGRLVRVCSGARPQNVDYYFKSGVTWGWLPLAHLHSGITQTGLSSTTPHPRHFQIVEPERRSFSGPEYSRPSMHFKC